MAKKKAEAMSLADNLIAGLMNATGRELTIIEFVEGICDGFDKKLFPQQRTLLKAIYGLDMDEEELEIIHGWYAERKTNWLPQKLVLAEINADRAAKGLPPKDSFKYQEISLGLGMRSGKSSTVGLIAAYEFYKLITHPSPQDKYGLTSSSTIYITVLASTEKQTIGTIFSYVKNYISDSTFFKTMIERGEIIVKEGEIVAPQKHIIIGSGHSKADSIVGRTALGVLFDEIAMFSTDEGRTSNAGDVYARVGRAVMSFPKDGFRIALSSAKQSGDFMEELVNTNWDRQKEGALVFEIDTFSFNPNITREDASVASEYVRDPVAAQRDFENIRPTSAYAFINPFIVDAATKMRDPVTGMEMTIPEQGNAIYRPIDIRRVNPTNMNEIRDMVGLEVSWIKDIENGSSYGHGDPGLVYDRYAFACGHPEVTDKGLVTVIDICLEWVPRELGKGRRAVIDYLNVEDVLIQVAKARKISHLSFDTWNSEGSIQRLFREGIPTFKVSFARTQQKEMYDSLRTRLNQGLVKIPNHPALIEELKNLEVTSIAGGGERIDHPKNKESTAVLGRGKISKDLADCIAVVNWHIATQEKVFARDAHQHYSGNQTGSVTAIGDTRALHRVNWRFGQYGH